MSQRAENQYTSPENPIPGGDGFFTEFVNNIFKDWGIGGITNNGPSFDVNMASPPQSSSQSMSMSTGSMQSNFHPHFDLPTPWQEPQIPQVQIPGAKERQMAENPLGDIPKVKNVVNIDPSGRVYLTLPIGTQQVG